MSIVLDGDKGVTQNTTEAARLPSGTTAERPANPVAGMIRFNTDLNYFEGYDAGQDAWLRVSEFESPLAATGGTETTITDNGVDYKVHTFTSSGTFEVTQGSGEVEYLVVAGGGGGGGRVGAGGGAGGILTGTFSAITQNYSISVGAGGFGGNGSELGPNATNGNDSSFTGDFIAIGGGFGAGSENIGESGGDGGSGGGGQRGGTSNGGSGTAGQGNDGGDGSSDASGSGGGGGGAGEPGTNGSLSSGGDGGDGIESSIAGSSVFYGGGGGGGSGLLVPDNNFGTGGAGGGANGSYSVDADAGVNNSGGGGGGGGYDGTGHDGGNGGSGIVIIRYPI